MYTLLTGATGLVGRYLVRDLLLNGHRLAVVVRGSRKKTPQVRIEEIMQHWEQELGRPLPRPVVIEGNIAEEGFAFSSADADWVRSHCDKIIHSAAILEFYGKDRAGEPWRTNLGGTRHMIQLCRDLDIRDIHYVSTAYVAGMQDNPILEDSLAADQTFRNDYEESKFLAEQEVRAIDFADHVTVYRPAVISGDSVTGYTNTYHGIYLYLRLMALMIPAQPKDENGLRHTPIRLRMDGTERRNIIPVDWVSAVTVRIFETQEARGGTYHMAPDNPLTSKDMVDWCSEYFNATGATLCGRDFKLDTDREGNEDQWMFEKIITENMGTYEPYERTDNKFDMTNTKRFAGDIVCPEIDRTVMHRYIDFGNRDKWGKTRPTPLSNSTWAMDSVSSLTSVDSGFGLDIAGAGGVQVTVSVTNGNIEIIRGLPLDRSVPIVRCTMEELESRNADLSNVPESVAEVLRNAFTVESPVNA